MTWSPANSVPLSGQQVVETHRSWEQIHIDCVREVQRSPRTLCCTINPADPSVPRHHRTEAARCIPMLQRHVPQTNSSGAYVIMKDVCVGQQALRALSCAINSADGFAACAHRPATSPCCRDRPQNRQGISTDTSKGHWRWLPGVARSQVCTLFAKTHCRVQQAPYLRAHTPPCIFNAAVELRTSRNVGNRQNPETDSGPTLS